MTHLQTDRQTQPFIVKDILLQGSYYQDCEKLCEFYAKFGSITNLCQNKNIKMNLNVG